MVHESEATRTPKAKCRILQRNERGRQGRQRAMFMTEISKQEAKSAAKARLPRCPCVVCC